MSDWVDLDSGPRALPPLPTGNTVDEYTSSALHGARHLPCLALHPYGRDWSFIAKQPASVPHMLRIVPRTVLRVGRSCENFPDGFELYLPRSVWHSCYRMRAVRPVHLIITMMKWIRTSRLSMNNSRSPPRSVGAGGGALLGSLFRRSQELSSSQLY
jgi:hypothetical protein